MPKILKGVTRDECGQDVVEYALFIFCVAMLAIAIAPMVSTQIQKIWDSLGKQPPADPWIRLGAFFLAICCGLLIARRKKSG